MPNLARLKHKSSTTTETRADRAKRILPAVRSLVERSSLRQAVTAITGTAGKPVSIGAIRSLLDGGTPQESTLQAIEDWAIRAGELAPPPVVEPIGRPVWLAPEAAGKIILQIRKRLSWSQQKLAEYVGSQSGQAEVSRWENGHGRPGYETLAMIAGLVGRGVEIFQEGGPGFDRTGPLAVELQERLASLVRQSTEALQMLTQESAPPALGSANYIAPGVAVAQLVSYLVQERGFPVDQLRITPDGKAVEVLGPDGALLARMVPATEVAGGSEGDRDAIGAQVQTMPLVPLDRGAKGSDTGEDKAS